MSASEIPKEFRSYFCTAGRAAGLIPMYRQFFDPAAYHVILFDQRGSGQSTPHAELRENTTWDLITISKPCAKNSASKNGTFSAVRGEARSASRMASRIRTVVSGLILRGIFLTRRKELQWFYQYGASEIFPDFWERYRDEIPEAERGDFITAYHKRLTSDDEAVRLSPRVRGASGKARPQSFIQTRI